MGFAEHLESVGLCLSPNLEGFQLLFLKLFFQHHIFFFFLKKLFSFFVSAFVIIFLSSKISIGSSLYLLFVEIFYFYIHVENVHNCLQEYFYMF